MWGGVLTPQNRELVSTADLVREIASVNGKKIIFTGLFNWAIGPACRLIRLARRAFADDCYDLCLSENFGYKYCVVNFKESIKKTEEK